MLRIKDSVCVGQYAWYLENVHQQRNLLYLLPEVAYDLSSYIFYFL